MDGVASLIRILIDGSWRVGIPLTIAGLVIFFLHRLGLPEPGVPTPYLGWATVGLTIGLSFTIVSAIAGIISAARDARYRRKLAQDAIADLQANLTSLSPAEFILFAQLLEDGAIRLKVHRLSDAYVLVEKGVLYRLEGGIEPMCEVPKEIREHKAEILANLPRVRAMLG